jgi:hypothetical protein
MTASAGNVRVAAESLGVSWRQMMRWLAEPEFADVPRSDPKARAKRAPPLSGR